MLFQITVILYYIYLNNLICVGRFYGYLINFGNKIYTAIYIINKKFYDV